MAHKKGAGSSRNGRESESKRLGVKLYGGQVVNGMVKFTKKRDNKSYVSIEPVENQ